MPLVILLPNKAAEFTQLEASLTRFIDELLEVEVILKCRQILLHFCFAVLVVLSHKISNGEPFLSERKCPINWVVQAS